ncbi:MAG: hypothetical protein QOH97_3024 [Actinoplanes sp.]|jgi:hypothetical protein|nr:hypothetical protein [Actinoplanes sp.]
MSETTLVKVHPDQLDSGQPRRVAKWLHDAVQ